MGRKLMRRVLGLFALTLLSLSVMVTASFAAGVEWTGGFPKLSEKNALLQWNPAKGASEYRVYRSEQKGKAQKQIAAVKVNRYIDKDLPAGKVFYYSVTAVVGGKEGERSPEGKVETVKAKVYVPLKAPRLEGGHVIDRPGGKVSVGIRWEGAAGSELIGVNVYRSKAKGKDYLMVGSSQTDTYTDDDVQKGEAYYYVVTAVDSQFKETKYSNEVEVSIAAPAAPREEQAVEAPPTEMRSTRLLFRIPKETGRKGKADPFVPTNAQDVAVDEAVGHIYVTSIGYGGVLVYNMQGELQFGIRKDGVNGDKLFGSVEGIALGDGGNIYVADFAGPEIRVFDFAGKPVETITVDIKHMPSYKDKPARNYGIATDSKGNLYVCDPVSNSVHVYSKDRKRLFDIIGVRVKEEVRKDRQLFNGPTYITITKEGDIVFVDSGYSKMMEYGKSGAFKMSIGKPGSNAGELYYPVGVARGNAGEIFVASSVSPNIQAFSPDGKFLYALCNEKCDGPIEANSIRGIYVDSKNRIYVTEGLLNRVSVFQLGEKTIEITPPK